MPPKARTPEELQHDALSYEAETGKLFWKQSRPKVNAGDEAGWTEPYRNTHYRRVTLGYKRRYAHHLVWEMHNGPIPSGKFIDHIDGNGLNNRLDNLRVVSVSDNNKNARRASTNTSGVTGVSYDSRRSKWRAYLKQDDKQVSLGWHDSKEAAIEARTNANSQYGYHPNHGRA